VSEPPPGAAAPEDGRPEPLDHGTVVHGNPLPTTRSHLARLFADRVHPEIDLVWTPTSGGPVPPWEAPVVVDAVARRIRAEESSRLFQSAVVGVAVWLFVRGAPREAKAVGWLVFALFVAIPAAVSAWRAVRARAAARARLRDAKSSLRLAWLVSRRRPVATWVVVAALAVLFFVERDPDRAVRAAGLVHDRVREEPWRLLTAGLLHGHEIHLAANGLSFLTLGRLTESVAHRAHLLVVFVLSVVAGSLASAAITRGNSLGASGGILGLLGFLTVLTFRHRAALPGSLWRALVLNVGLMAALGWVLRSLVDNAAHAGGFLAGALLAFPLGARAQGLPVPARGAVRVAAWVCGIGLAVAAAWTLRLLTGLPGRR
jgi:membrane associated rhomboid family serine protease